MCMYGLLVLNVRVIFPLAKWSFSTAGTDNPASVTPSGASMSTHMVPPTGLTPDIRVTVSVAVVFRPPPENLHALEMQRAPRFYHPRRI